jgi:hypothetical protein
MLNPDVYVEESLPVDSIKSPRILVRQSEASSAHDNTIRELAASMRQHGLLHPIIVRPIEEGFEIVAGNRRFEACRLLRWKNIPAKVRELSEKDAFELQLVEKELKDSVDFLTRKKDKLESDCQFFGSQIDVHSQTLAKYKELEKMGFGLKEQKLLWHKVREIGAAYQMNPKEAVQKFLKDLEEEYYTKLGFEAKIQTSKSELQDNALKMQNMDSRIARQNQNNESVKQFVSSILGTQIEQLTRLSEFSPLTQAAKGEVVAPNELKFSLRKAIETVLGRLDPNDSITKVLETTKLELEKTAEPRSSTSSGSDIWG